MSKKPDPALTAAQTVAQEVLAEDAAQLHQLDLVDALRRTTASTQLTRLQLATRALLISDGAARHAAGKTRERRRKALEMAKDDKHRQRTAKVKDQRQDVLRRELRLTPDQPLDADTLKAARALLAKHKLGQRNDTRLRNEIRAAMT